MSQVSQPGARGFLLHIQTLFPPAPCRELGWLLGAPTAARGWDGCWRLPWVLDLPGQGAQSPRCPRSLAALGCAPALSACSNRK